MSQLEHLTAKPIGIPGTQGTEYISPEGKYERDWINCDLCDREVEGLHLAISSPPQLQLLLS